MGGALTGMGRFTVKIRLANFGDARDARRGLLAPENVRSVEIDGLVDTGATWMVLPSRVGTQLGLPVVGKNTVQYADGRREQKEVFGELEATVCGRSGIFKATMEPNRETALIGAILMEDLDLLVDCKNGELRPRDPEVYLTEIG
jgi:predicted aspartyl protease